LEVILIHDDCVGMHIYHVNSRHINKIFYIIFKILEASFQMFLLPFNAYIIALD